ncbi:MAG: tetratricopeptide repeat protein [Leptolyngbya sp. SIO1D8]|nr:tetratricopeptide repeat protein [Leptolyngbya sp. SIO1D8]
MSAANRLLGGRYQFIQVLSANDAGQTLLVADVHYPGHPKCVVRQLRLPTRNPMTLKFLLKLLQKKVDVLEVIGRHKQIPSIFSSFAADHNFYLVQEFIPGQSLQSELVAGRPMSEHSVLAFLKEALTILAFAQDNGVIHGRLKPSKVIRHQIDNRLVLLDFGLIKNISQEVANKDSSQLAAQISRTNRIYGAPEQYKGESRFCSDHYALGMIAIQALTGLPAEELPHAEHPGVYQEITALLHEIPGVGINTISLLARMVNPDPNRRYQKAVEILADLGFLETTQPPPTSSAIIADSPLLTTEISIPEVELKPQKRKPWWLLGGAGLALLALLAAVIGLRLPQRVLSSQRVRDAQAEEQADQLQTALAHYTRALELNPSNREALAGRSQLYFEAGDPEAALSDITKAIEVAPNDPQHSYTRANFRFAVGDTQGAIADYTNAIRQDPTFVKAHVNRGSARADWGDDQGAIEDYTKAIELDPPAETQAAAYLNRCLSRSNLNEQETALEDCSAAINLRPNHGLAYQNRGLVRRRLGDFQGALQDYNIAIQIEPDSPDPYYNRGLTRQDMDDLSGALEDFSQAIEIDPSYVFAFYDRGLLRLHLGRRSQALADFRQASQLCLDLGRTGCYEDAQYQILQLQGN